MADKVVIDREKFGEALDEFYKGKALPRETWDEINDLLDFIFNHYSEESEE